MDKLCNVSGVLWRKCGKYKLQNRYRRLHEESVDSDTLYGDLTDYKLGIEIV